MREGFLHKLNPKRLYREMTDKELRPIYKSILVMSGPAFVELFLSSLYGIVNMVMVGNLDAETPGNISAVGITNQPFFLLISFFAAINIGTTTLVAWRIGAGERREAPAILRQSLMVNIFLSIVLGFAGVLFAPQVMGFMSTDAFIVGKAVPYFQIICVSLPFMAINQAITAALRGAGQTKIPMYYNLLANALNVLFGYMLIFGKLGAPAMGVTGAALAATLARAVSAIIPLLYVFINKNSVLRVKIWASWKPRIDIIKLLLSIGIPSSLEQIALQSGLLLFHRVVNALGATTYDAHQIAISINSMAFSVSQAFSVATTTLVGQAVGVGDYSQAEQKTRLSIRVSRLASITVALLVILFSRPLISMYTSVPEVTDIAAPVFYIIGAITFVQAAQMCRAGALRGAGDTMYPFYSSLFGIWLFRVPLAYLFTWLLGPYGFGLAGAWLSFLFDQSLRNYIVKRRFDKGKWKEIKDKKDKRRMLQEKAAKEKALGR